MTVMNLKRREKLKAVHRTGKNAICMQVDNISLLYVSLNLILKLKLASDYEWFTVLHEHYHNSPITFMCPGRSSIK